MRLGIDIGRVLISPNPVGGNGDTSFLGASVEDAVRTPPYPGMFDVVPILVTRFDGAVWLVSKAQARTQEKTRRWLYHHRFFERTGISPSNLRFCLQRREKADHCRELALTHFVDDRADVLQYLKGIVPHRYLFGPQQAPNRDSTVVSVSNWPEAALHIVP